MTMTRREFKPLGVRIVWVAAIADDKVSITTIHHDSVEAQDATIASAADSALYNRTTAFGEKAIDDLHLRDETLRIDDEVRFATVVVDGELS